MGRMTGMMGRREVLLPIAESRSRSYWLAAGFFLTPPGQGFVDGLKAQLSDLGEPAEGGAPEAVRRLAGALEEFDVDRLGVEYTRLFCGIQEGYGPPPPFESLYREGCLMGETTHHALGQYAAAGFGKIDASVNPQDHIGAELKFMSLLCYEESSALDRDDEEAVARLWAQQDAFMNDHLAVWVPDYCRQVEAESREPFYAAAAALTAAILEADRLVLGEYNGRGGLRPADPRASFAVSGNRA